MTFHLSTKTVLAILLLIAAGLAGVEIGTDQLELIDKVQGLLDAIGEFASEE